MKKTMLALALVSACIACAFADAPVAKGNKVYPVAAPASISSGATNTAVIAVERGLHFGPCFIIESASASADGKVIATAFTTNVLAGGWREISTVTNVGVKAVGCINYAGYLDPFVKVELNAVGSNAVAGAILIAR